MSARGQVIVGGVAFKVCLARGCKEARGHGYAFCLHHWRMLPAWVKRQISPPSWMGRPAKGELLRAIAVARNVIESKEKKRSES